jgi:probable Rubsico expression protein CbbX
MAPSTVGSSSDPVMADDTPVDLRAAYEGTGVGDVLDQLDRELIGLKPVKMRIREIAALLVVERARKQVGLATAAPSLHMSFTGHPGTGKTTVAERISEILHRLGYVRKGHLVTATRDDLVGQYIGHTAPKTREMLKRAMGGVLFIDEAYYLYRPENERDYGAEAIEILLQVMENNRDDLVVIFAGYKDKMDIFYQSNPGLSSRVANHIDFPDYTAPELLAIAKLILAGESYRFSDEASIAFSDYIQRRMLLPFFANARSIRNAIDRARMRQANRLFNTMGRGLTKRDLITIEAEDITASSVFQGRVEGLDRSLPLT